ncbi:hypothetical protein BRYFOR_06314 [Marvinbryantia formatexigens DSM 14469]|uniref:Uncharacterized protein n=1 Tax=Marvinbryantia formatexigens DSM 14469 TaxID=478749 RepID=C6LCG7_9FIRM|nr:hypothetical protein BRYFOR_06314 [Marvinbryantia formatexigens DSM 14469]
MLTAGAAVCTAFLLPFIRQERPEDVLVHGKSICLPQRIQKGYNFMLYCK